MSSHKTLTYGMTAALVAATLMASGFCATASAETRPGQMECFKLRQNCLAHAQKLNAVTPAATGSEKLTAEQCEKLYVAATDTGVWPPYKGFPAARCAK